MALYSVWRYTLWCYTVYSAIQCTALYSVRRYTVYGAVQCTALYSVRRCTVYGPIQCMVLYSVCKYSASEFLSVYRIFQQTRRLKRKQDTVKQPVQTRKVWTYCWENQLIMLADR
jgi:hypothetical protein